MKTSPLAILCVYSSVFAAVWVDAADVVAGRSDTSRLIKPTSFLSKFFQGTPSSEGNYVDAASPAVDISGADVLDQTLNVASAVTVTRNFLSKDETALFRLNENKYQRLPAVGFSGNRMWGGAYLPRSFLHKLVDVGGQQCASEEYENSLPAGVHILTNHVTETTDPHVDYNPTTLERIENDVAVVFLNSNPDATFYVEDEGYPVEEGMLITFPGGSLPHHIEMKKEKEDDGFVHMLGPLEVGGSHGTVGQVVQVGGRKLATLIAASEGTQTAAADLKPLGWFRRMRELDGSEEESATSSTTQQYGTNPVTGEITVTGYRDGIDPNGVTNHTLEVAYRLEGLSVLNYSTVNCFSADIIKDQPDFCDSAKIGQIMNDAPSDQSDNSTTFLDVEECVSDVIEGVMYVNIGKPVTYFFDTPAALYRQDETMLACSVFTEVEAAAEEDTTSGASSYRAAMWTIVAVFVSSAFALIASL